jgi:hypothetical protein
MKSTWPTKLGLPFIAAGCMFLSGCSSLNSATETPATVAYMWGNSQTMGNSGGLPQTVLAYSTTSAASSSPTGTLTLPPLYEGWPLAADSTGQLYVGGLNGSVLAYSPNSAGAATPSRTISVSSSDEIINLAVDPKGLLYVGTVGMDRYAVTVYSAEASGAALPLRTVQLPYSDSVQFLDVTADAAGTIYVVFYPAVPSAGPLGYIDVYAPDATGPTPTRTITFPSVVYGVAVDGAGHLFADTCPTLAGCTIEEFAPDANGAASPINTITVPNQPAGMQYWGGPVSLDGAGNIFVSSGIRNPSTDVVNFFIYGFAPTATGNATPSRQITGSQETTNSHFAIN